MTNRLWTVAVLGALASCVLGSAPASAQTPAFVCTRGARTDPPVTGVDFRTVFTADRQEGPTGTLYRGDVNRAGIFCYNVQSAAVAFTGFGIVSSTGDQAALRVGGYCINGLCVDGTPPSAIAPGAFIAIPVAFIPSVPGLYSQTFTILNGNGLPSTTLTVSGNAITAPPVPALGLTGFVLFAGALASSGVIALLRR